MDGFLKVVDTYVTKKSDRSRQRLAYDITEEVWKRKSADDLGIDTPFIVYKHVHMILTCVPVYSIFGQCHGRRVCEAY